MIPSTKAIETAFNYYNQKYFHNQLPPPKFSLSCPDGMWGCFEPSGDMRRKGNKIVSVPNPPGILSLTSKWDRDEKSIINTLLHEMVHMYVYCVRMAYERDPHGQIFTQKASEINRDGWNVMAENEKLDSDVEANGVEPTDEWSEGTFGASTQTNNGGEQEQPQQTQNTETNTQQNTTSNDATLSEILQRLRRLSQMVQQYIDSMK